VRLRLSGGRLARRPLTAVGLPADDGAALARARRLHRVVEIAARHGVARGTCLSRSLTLLELLRREGVSGELRIGVREPGATFEAHAWVEHRGVVLNDDESVRRRYAAFGTLAPREAASPARSAVP
jgi:hypothetical protein